LLNIEIKGVEFSNKGAELMLVAILQQLDKELDDYNITLSPRKKLPYLKRARLGAWQKLSFRRGNIDLTGIFSKLPNLILNFFKQYGVVTEKDVDIILDASGFAYGDQWGEKSLSHTAKEISRFSKEGKKYIFLPQALGPFHQGRVRELAQDVFSKASLVFPRDGSSFQALSNLKLTSETAHIQKCPDFTCLVEPEPSLVELQKLDLIDEKKLFCIIPNSKMVSSYHHDNAEKDKQGYVDFLIHTAKFYQSLGWAVVILNHEGEEDQVLCQEISQQLEGNVIVKQDLSALEVKAFISTTDAVLSSRYHGCISALTQGIPCLATSWSHKYQMLFQEYNILDNVIDYKSQQFCLEDKLISFTNCLEEQKQNSLKHASIVKQQTRNMWTQVFSTLNS